VTSGVPAGTMAAWLALMAITLASFWLGTGHAPGGASARSAAAVVVSAAFAKAFLVGWHFMEIRAAAVALRWAFTVWTALFGTLCTTFVLL
jgi:hypothetical protein